MRDKILTLMQEIAEESNTRLLDSITNDTVLLESGLDSLGFAILVAKLEQQLGYDPFALMEEPVYPQTFGEFVEIYQRFS